MSTPSYLSHRAMKFAKPSQVELRLIDSDLAAAGVHIPWSLAFDADEAAMLITQRVMHDVLEAA